MNNYRDFFSKKIGVRKDIKSFLPEGVSLKEFNRGIKIENESIDDEFTAAKIAGGNLENDPNYYSKIHGDENDVEVDDNGGLPLVGGALAVPHVGRPISLGKIVQIGGEFGGGPATGELSGMKAMSGKNASYGNGIPAKEPGDKETMLAGGKEVPSEIISRSVGGSIVPGAGQKQAGPNHKGSIAGTSKLTEGKNKVRSIVKKVLKEITFDKKSGKWIKLNETLDMKMGPSHKTVQQRLYKTAEDDFARTNQYEPEITEMVDDDEECMMNERYVELANASRNLSEAELNELKELRDKIDNIQENKDKWIQKAVNPSHKGYCTPMSKSTCTPHRKALAKRFKSHDLEEARCEDYPCCGHEDGDCPSHDSKGNEVWKCASCGRKLPLHSRSSLCQKCIRNMNIKHASGDDVYDDDMDETLDMKMGPSHKTVQQRLYKTAEDDFARSNQYNPKISENEDEEIQFKNGDKVELTPQYAGSEAGEVFTLSQWDGKKGRISDKDGRGWNIRGYQIMLAKSNNDDSDDEPMNTAEMQEDTTNNNDDDDKSTEKGHKGQVGFNEWECQKCGHEVISKEKPENIKWTDGHICRFVKSPNPEKSMKEMGGQGVQTRSYRTVDDVPQNAKARWSDEVTETKMSQVAKTIKKGMKPKIYKKASKIKKK